MDQVKKTSYFFSTGAGNNAPGESAYYYWDKFRGFNPYDATHLDVYFESSQSTGSVDTIRLTITSGKHKEISDILLNNITFNNYALAQDDSIVVIYDGDASPAQSINSIITGCSITYGPASGFPGVSMTNGSDNRIVTATGADSITGEPNLTYIASSNILSLVSTIDNRPHIQLISANADSGGPELAFYNILAGEDNDDLGEILFQGVNAASSGKTFGRILSEIVTAAVGDEAGKLSLTVACSNSSTSADQQALTATGHGTSNIVNINLAFGATSTTTVVGGLTVEGAAVKLTGSLPTSDPGVAGQIWNNSTTLKISAG